MCVVQSGGTGGIYRAADYRQCVGCVWCRAEGQEGFTELLTTDSVLGVCGAERRDRRDLQSC
jgi:hypothetical protein